MTQSQYQPNLYSINSSFQDQCWSRLFTSSLPMLILCDFPAKMSDPPSNCKISGLDGFSQFLNLAILDIDCDVKLSLIFNRYWLFVDCCSPGSSSPTTHPLYQSYQYIALWTQDNRDHQYQTLPINMFKKITRIQYISSFPGRLKGKKDLGKQFDLFNLNMDPSTEIPSLLLPSPTLFVHGLTFRDHKGRLTKKPLNL